MSNVPASVRVVKAPNLPVPDDDDYAVASDRLPVASEEEAIFASGNRQPATGNSYEPTDEDWADYRAHLEELEVLEWDRREVLEKIRREKIAGANRAIGVLRAEAIWLQVEGRERRAAAVLQASRDVETVLTLL